MTFKVNDIVTMQYQALWWNKGAVGHIVRIDHNTQGEPLYLICFDSSCIEWIIVVVLMSIAFGRENMT
jgi:hypothetical protein